MRNRRLKDLTGQRYGRLVVMQMIERGERPENNHIMRFQCDCGNIVDRKIKVVRSGHSQSCGCIARECLIARNQVHGLSHTKRREYRSWKDMRSRCRNPNDSDYSDYGGRGITICEQWSDFAVFFADMGDRPQGSTLDRINVNGNYEPANCRWADHKVQANNKRSNHLIEFNGETKTLQAWCDQFGLEPSKVRYRLRVGYSPEEALSREDKRIDGSNARCRMC